MKKTKLGEFEEMVLLAVIVLKEEAYGVEIKKELETRLSERLSVGSIQSALKRMEEKGFLESEFGEATNKRGGKRKRIYTATPYAHQVLTDIKEIREGFWSNISLSADNLKTI
ncbi:MAG: helix-turn-helix transcriptional regulator [Cyclobacteriaceae bacterium]